MSSSPSTVLTPYTVMYRGRHKGIVKNGTGWKSKAMVASLASPSLAASIGPVSPGTEGVGLLAG